MPERFKKGGNVSRLVENSSGDRMAMFKQAAADGSWLAASVKTPQLFPELIENVTEAISAYKKAMETGKTLMYANRAFLVASINPLFLLLDAMISKIQNGIDDLMGAGIYWIFVNGQNPKLSVYDVKSRTPNIRIKKVKSSGIYINPFTNKIEFTAYPLIDIDDMKAAEGNQPHRPGVPHEKSWEIYENNHKNYVIWNGKVFYNRVIPGVSGSAQGKPVLAKTGGEFHDINLEDYMWKLGGQMQVCKPSKMIEILNDSFDDKGDVERPVISADGTSTALIIIAGASDPAKIVGKLAKLYNYFADLKPIKDALDIAIELTEDLDSLREEKIIITNLMAPNPNMDNPSIKDWPIKPGKKSNLKADRDVFKIGTNSDNSEKFRRRGYDIKSNKDDKVFFKNLRTRETMQIIGAGTAREYEATASAGTDETSNAEWYDHINPNSSHLAAEASIDLFVQGTTPRYEQEIDVLHETLHPNTRPGDILIEVELDDRFGVIDDEGMPTKPDPGGGDAHKVLNSYVLKNGTKIFGEDDEKENIMTQIMANRRWKHDAQAGAKQLELYQYYNGKINEGKYNEELTYERILTPAESSAAAERYENSSNKADTAISVQETKNEALVAQIEALLAPGRGPREEDRSEDLIAQTEADKKTVQTQISALESGLENWDGRIKEQERKISVWEAKRTKEVQGLGEIRQRQFDLSQTVGEQVDAETDLAAIITDLENSEKQVRDYEESHRQGFYDEAYDREMLRIGNTMTFGEAHVIADKYALSESTPFMVSDKLYNSDSHYVNISVHWVDLKGRKTKAEKTLADAKAAAELADANATSDLEEEDISSSEDQILFLDSQIATARADIIFQEEEKQKDQTKIMILEGEIVVLDEAIASEELRSASDLSTYDDKIQALELELQNGQTKLENLYEAAGEASDYWMDFTEKDRDLEDYKIEQVAYGTVSPRGSHVTETGGNEGSEFLNMKGGPDKAGGELWTSFLTDLVNSDPDDKDVDKPPYAPEELGDLTDEESAWAARRILEGSGLEPKDINIDMLRYFEALLDGYLWLPKWRNSGTKKLPAPRVCTVQAINKNTLKKEDLPESVYPDFGSMQVEEFLPDLRPILEKLIDFLEGLKGLGSGLIKKIDELIEFIEEKLIPKLEKILKMMEEFLELIKIGIVDAGIYFLFIPPAIGGTDRVRKALTSAGNPPPENIDFTYGLMLFSGGPDATAVGNIIEASGLAG